MQYSNTALNILFPLILFPYTTRVLGPHGYGVIGFYESLLLLVNVLAAFGVGYYGLRLLSRSAVGDTYHANAVLHLLLINVLISLAGTLVYFAYLVVMHVPIGSRAIMLLYGYIMLIYQLHADWYFQSQEKFGFLLARTFVLRLFVLLASLMLVRKQEHLLTYICISACNYTFISISTLWFIRSLFPHWKWDRQLFNKLLAALWPFAMVGILGSVYLSLDTILLARYGRIEELGHYTVAAKMVRLSLNVFIGASIVFFVRLFRTQVDKSLQADSMLLTIHLSTPIAALLFFLAEPVIQFVSGSSYLPAVPILQCFALLWMLVPLHDFFIIQVLMVHHREKLLAKLYATACLLSLALNLVFIPRWFNQGAAYAIVLTDVFLLAASLYFSRRYFRIQPYMVKEWLLCLLCFPISWGMTVLVFPVTQTPITRLLAGVIGSLLLYFILQWWVLRNAFWKKLWKGMYPAEGKQQG